MTRLFWKLFAALFLALAFIAIAVGNMVQWQMQPPHLLASQPAASTQASVSSTLEAYPSVVSLSHALKHVHLLSSLPPSVLVFCVIASALFAAVLAWSIAYPVKLLLAHLKAAADGDLLAEVSTKIKASHDEFAELGEAFDLMALRLNTMMKSQSNMLHHVSHELRSPLARIQMAVGLVMQNPKKMQSSLQRVELEAVRMEKMIAELLEIFRLESGMQKLQKTEVDLKALLAGIVSDVQFEKQEARIQLDMPDDAVYIRGQLELLQRAIENVIRNAVKYGPVLGIVAVELQRSQRTREVIVEVRDQGNGVEQQELEQIFRPFMRGHSASQIDGHGIGLAMTKHIVEAHGGFVKAANLSPLGFMVRIHLPLDHKAYAG
ncbi:two-component system, OmpR family, sensor kinase [Methylophilus rhizosphaerae]|uniref:histidine kinase n=1 Tax=Methylophilus rhizosphaerae TaxID=492660 RepID=A0A1G9BD45_9PROT|nr:ATP-binding protein [Methylophilus rhizosphaerae]SDK37389.1 two-component system, OmpR family, sensor kinase [Methylophilus rhizosphaerae]